MTRTLRTGIQFLIAAAACGVLSLGGTSATNALTVAACAAAVGYLWLAPRGRIEPIDPPPVDRTSTASCYHPRPVEIESVIPDVGTVAWWCPTCDVHGATREALGWTAVPPKPITAPAPKRRLCTCRDPEVLTVREFTGEVVAEWCGTCYGRIAGTADRRVDW